MKKKTGSRSGRGQFLTDEQLQDGETPRARALEAGRRKKVHEAAKRRKTEREFLRRFVAGITARDIDRMRAAVVERACKGDKDACAFLGRFIFGNGRTSLADVAHPPMIRKTR